MSNIRFDLQFFIECFFSLFSEVPNTLMLGTSSFLFSFFIALIIHELNTSSSKILNNLASIYISFFRSTPYISQLFIFYFGLPQIFPGLARISAEWSLILSIALNSAAYNVGIIRGGLLSVNRGQTEAALSIGLTRWQTFKEIVFPQALTAAFPSLMNSYISQVKNIAIGFTIGVVDILSSARIAGSSSLNFLEAYLAAGLLYWIVIGVIDFIGNHLEIKINRYI